VDLETGDEALFDRLVELGALDAERSGNGGIVALMPDSLPGDRLARALRPHRVRIAAAVGRDDDSIWTLGLRSIRVAGLDIVPAHLDAPPGAVRLLDSSAFGTGLHPTTWLCLEAVAGEVGTRPVSALLDVGTGSGILALAALRLGVPAVAGLDTDDAALRAAADNAALNDLADRFRLVYGGPESIAGTWPVVVANVLPAPLIEMASTLVRRIGHHGRLVLSGVGVTMEADVHDAYRRLGMRRLHVAERGGWVALTMQATW
jgi:ribosomal protein L11 methyltransferase